MIDLTSREKQIIIISIQMGIDILTTEMARKRENPLTVSDVEKLKRLQAEYKTIENKLRGIL